MFLYSEIGRRRVRRQPPLDLKESGSFTGAVTGSDPARRPPNRITEEADAGIPEHSSPPSARPVSPKAQKPESRPANRPRKPSALRLPTGQTRPGNPHPPTDGRQQIAKILRPRPRLTPGALPRLRHQHRILHGTRNPCSAPAPDLPKIPMMTAAHSGTRRRCLYVSTHIVSQTYDKPNTLVLESEK